MHDYWNAGRLYARGLKEAPGHAEARRSELRAFSRKLHAFLRFNHSAGLEKRTVRGDCRQDRVQAPVDPWKLVSGEVGLIME